MPETARARPLTRSRKPLIAPALNGRTVPSGRSALAATVSHVPGWGVSVLSAAGAAMRPVSPWSIAAPATAVPAATPADRAAWGGRVEFGGQTAVQSGDELLARGAAAGPGCPQHDRGLGHARVRLAGPEPAGAAGAYQIINVPGDSAHDYHSIAAAISAARRNARCWSTLALVTLIPRACAASATEHASRNLSWRILRYRAGRAARIRSARCGAADSSCGALKTSAGSSFRVVTGWPRVRVQYRASTVRAVANR